LVKPEQKRREEALILFGGRELRFPVEKRRKREKKLGPCAERKGKKCPAIEGGEKRKPEIANPTEKEKGGAFYRKKKKKGWGQGEKKEGRGLTPMPGRGMLSFSSKKNKKNWGPEKKKDAAVSSAPPGGKGVGSVHEGKKKGGWGRGKKRG